MGLARRSACASVLLFGLFGQASAQAPEQQDLRYSVLVSSLASLDDARTLQQRLQTPTVPYYVVPVQVNRQVYYRVLAGLYPDRDQAVGLMNDLVAQGIKESASAWHVRDAGLAFRMGSYVSEAESRRALAVALGDGIPAYTVVSMTALGPRYEVMAGGFENEAEAAYLQGRLAAQGMNQPLQQRRGIAPADAPQVLAAAQSAAEAEPPASQPMEPDSAPVAVAEEPEEEAPPPAQDPVTPPVEESPPEEEAPPVPPPGERVQEPDSGVLSGALPARPLPPPPQDLSRTGFEFSLGVAGGASPGLDTYHGYGGVLIHPRYGKVGLLGHGMLGRGAGYDSMVGYGALSILFGEYGPLGVWGLGGYGYYEETGVLDQTRDLLLPTAGALVTYDIGPAQLLGSFTAMFGTFEEPGISIDLRVYRGSIGVAYTTSRRGS